MFVCNRLWRVTFCRPSVDALISDPKSTSGNRVFRCEGREAFRTALRANREGVNPVTQIEEHLGLALTRDQQRVVLQTVDQVKAIVAKERIECG